MKIKLIWYYKHFQLHFSFLQYAIFGQLHVYFWTSIVMYSYNCLCASALFLFNRNIYIRGVRIQHTLYRKLCTFSENVYDYINMYDFLPLYFKNIVDFKNNLTCFTSRKVVVENNSASIT